MKFSAVSLFVLLAATAASVMGQVADTGYADDAFAREEFLEAREGIETGLHFALRELDEVRRRSEDHAEYISRAMERIERRDPKSACWSNCIASYAAGPSRDNCYKKCDKLYGHIH